MSDMDQLRPYLLRFEEPEVEVPQQQEVNPYVFVEPPQALDQIDEPQQEQNVLAVEPSRSRSNYSTSRDWMTEIKSRQSCNMTPEIQARIKAKAARQKRRGKKMKRAKLYQRANVMNKRAWGQGNARYLTNHDYTSVEYSTNQMQSIQTVYNNRSAWDAVDEEEADANYAVMETMLDQLEAVQLADDVQVDDNSMSAILNQLRREPTQEEELQAKFELYENFLATVEESRKATYDFWDDCKEEFESTANTANAQNAVAQVEADLTAIDGQDNLGIIFHEHRWFVYDMMVQADKNNDKLKDALHKIEIKLELIQKEDDDCPFCLENIAAEQLPFVTLACCHKACTECWTYWQELRGQRAFCPLCRNEDFLESIMS